MRTLALIPLLLLVACGDADSGPQLTARDFALVKVSGDGQADVVNLSGTASANRIPGSIRAAVAVDPGMFPEPLVVKVVPRGGASFYRGGSLMPTSPSFAEVPGWLPTVTWRVVEEGCGEAFTAAEQPDADSTVATFWFKGTKAGPCRMRAQTVERDSAGNLTPIVQQEFTATQLPGPGAFMNLYRQETPTVSMGDTIDIRDWVASVKDTYGNDTDVVSIPGSAIHSKWFDNVSSGRVFITREDATLEGWKVVVPDTSGYRTFMRDGVATYSMGLGIYADGVLNATGSYTHVLTLWVRK